MACGGEAPLWLSKAIGRPTTRWPATSSSGIFTGGRKSGPGGTRIRTYPICLSILRADPWRGLERSLQGYELMEQAWHAYRKRYAKLDTYLREWLYDFMIVHGLDMPIRETYQRFPRVLSSELKEKEWKRRFTLQPVELTWEPPLDLLDYEVEKSRFTRRMAARTWNGMPRR